MPEPEKMQCGEFEALLSDAVEGKLTGQAWAIFQAHAGTCASCGPLYEPMMTEAVDGRRWLKSLVEVEPPADMISNILVATTGIDTLRQRGKTAATPWFERAREWASGALLPIAVFVRQPRFVMSFGMIFFALSVSLTLAGVKLNDVRHVDLRPSAVKRTYFETSGRVVKYYENIRFVYEIESRVREFKKATAPAETEPAKKDNRHTNDTSQEPEQRQERNYSLGESQELMAATPNRSPVVMLTDTYRRLS